MDDPGDPWFLVWAILWLVVIGSGLVVALDAAWR